MRGNLKVWNLSLTDILSRNPDFYWLSQSVRTPLVVIFSLTASLPLIFTILLMETWRVIKDNGPINTVISANKIFTGQHWVGIFDIPAEEKESEGKLSAKNVLLLLFPITPSCLARLLLIITIWVSFTMFVHTLFSTEGPFSFLDNYSSLLEVGLSLARSAPPSTFKYAKV